MGISVLIFHNIIWQILKADDIFQKRLIFLLLEVSRKETLHQPVPDNCNIIHILLQLFQDLFQIFFSWILMIMNFQDLFSYSLQCHAKWTATRNVAVPELY